MADEESAASLLAKRDYVRAVPLLKREHEKYPTNPRIRLQYADALLGAGSVREAVEQYEATARYYDDNGLTVQAIAVRKKAEKAGQQVASSAPAAAPAAPGKNEPLFNRTVPKSPLFEVLQSDEREALVKEMELESHEEGSVIISEGDPGDSMYVISSGEVKVYTRGTKGAVYLAKLGEGDFFGEVSMLTGKPRTATITACTPTEVLRLDKEKLDNALGKYPGIRKVLDEFYKKRATHTVEAMIESLKKKG
jgi:cAMP-dependent protein kinase regulator